MNTDVMENEIFNTKKIKNKNKLEIFNVEFQQEDLDEFFCGWCAAFVNISITFPINKIIFRQMAYGLEAKNAVYELKGKKMFYVYRGIVPPLISKTISVSLMFGTYHQYQKLLSNNNLINSGKFNKLISAIMAGCTEAILTPFERVQMLLQHKSYDNTFKNTFHAFLSLKKYGIREYYRGLIPILLRNGPSSAVYFTSRDYVKRKFSRSSFWYINIIQDFISGAFIGAVTSTMFYPLNVIRTKIQVFPVGHSPPKLFEALKILYIERDRSLRKVFYGAQANFVRSLLSWGIITSIYELSKKYVENFYN